MPEPTETVLDAVNAALGETNADPPEQSEVEDLDTGTPDGGDDNAASEDGESDDQSASSDGDEDGEGKDKSGESEDELDANGKPRERNADGTFKKPESDKPATGKEQAKAKDALNDPIPKDLKPETQARIRELIKTTKEAQTAATQAGENFNVFVNGLQAAGVTPQQYGETLSWLSLFNSGMSGNQANGEKALEILQAATERLATFLGKPLNVSDPLEQHADLKQAVAQKQLTPEYAREIARTRNQSKFRGEINTNVQTEAQKQEAARQEEQSARNGLTDFENQMRAKDPQYEAKKALLVPRLKAVMRNVPFNKWVDTFKAAYAETKVAPAQRRSQVPANQPLRGNKQPSGGQTRAAGSMLDAVNGALASLEK
jgi:hypothetical protein